MPKTPEEKFRVLQHFLKTLKQVLGWQQSKATAKRLNVLQTQINNLEQYLRGLCVSTEQVREWKKSDRAKVRDEANATVKQEAEIAREKAKDAEVAVGTPAQRCKIKASLEIAHLEKSAREYLVSAKAKGWVKGEYNTDDVEDIVAEAWLAAHDEKVLREELERMGLEWTSENLQLAHGLISERSRSNPKVSGREARRAVDRWKYKQQRRKESSLGKPLNTTEDGAELLLEDVLEDVGQSAFKNTDTDALRTVLEPKDAEVLLDYHRPEVLLDYRREPHSGKVRKRASKLLKKAKIAAKGRKSGHTDSLMV